ncbi:hypothetical protein B2G69_18115 [Methylorubrum zatmanii]|nr:hypothetical protein B2G69_18115 [Methylorubrum zatmanii]
MFAWIKRGDLHYASHHFVLNVATAFTQPGAHAIARLAEAVRSRSDEHRRAVDTRALSRWIAREIARIWSDGMATTDEERESAFGQTLDAWFISHAEPLTHFVPCAILREPAARFSLGPVAFVHRSEFDERDHGLHHEEAVSHEFGEFFELMEQRGANWVARVEVRGREADQSLVAAEFAVDIALGALQLIFGPRDAFRKFARTTGRMGPPRRYDIMQARDSLLSSSAWTAAGFGIHHTQFDDYIRRAADQLASMGRRLSAYLSGTGTTPSLDEAWCSAAFWYHEALAESLVTVGTMRLETAIEVLFRAESSRGSGRRIRSGIHAFYGLGPRDNINPRSQVTVEQLTAAIVGARSQVLHGTWPTLGSELPGSLGGLPLSFMDVEHLARLFLLDATERLDAYTAAGETRDDVDSFVAWVGLNPPPASAEE